ncbi:MAG: pyrroline-5-carboxylate reductase [Spirochaetota bacterium]
MKNIGIIGFGNMGEAICAGIKSEYSTAKIGVYEKIEDKCVRAQSNYDADIFVSWEEFFSFSAIVILAVKPQEAENLFRVIRRFTEKKYIVSVMAGRTIDYIKKNLKTGQVARLMPNIAATKRKAFTGMTFSAEAEDEFKKTVSDIAGTIGTALELPENLIPAVIGLSGSGIAYVFLFLHALALGGTEAGLPYPKSLEIAIATIEGAAAMVRETGEQPITLLTKVISPAGTTIQGIKVLEETGFTSGVMRAVELASRRAVELENL